MTAEEEQYYDSIDDSEFESCRSFCNTKFQDDDSDTEDNVKLDALVPFYNGNVEVDSIKNESKSNSSTTLKNKLKRRNNRLLIPTLERRKNRSYLTIFYAKSGLQSKSGISESGRATPINWSPKRRLSCDQDEKTSCYFDQVDNSERCYTTIFATEVMLLNGVLKVSLSSPITYPDIGCLKEEEKSKNENYKGGNLSVACMPCSRSASDTKLYSVSEMHWNPLDKSKKDSSIKLNKNRTRSRPVKVCELGGLGPNVAQEKLELLRRRQDYGRTVSQKNRLKMMENKVVQKLKNEIRESNKF